MRKISKLTCAAGILGIGLAVCIPLRANAQDERAPVRDPQHRVEIVVPSWKELRQRNIVMQKRDYSCGAAAMATVLRYYWGDAVSEDNVLIVLLATLTPEETKDRFKHGLAISDLRRTAVKMGYQSSIGTMSFEGLSGARLPLIVPLKVEGQDHFVVYRGMVAGRVYLADPIRGNVRPTFAEFSRQWQKNAILVVVKPGEPPRDITPLSIRWNEVLMGETSNQLLRGQLSTQPYLHQFH
jgi:hypothetical protein